MKTPSRSPRVRIADAARRAAPVAAVFAVALVVRLVYLYQLRGTALFSVLIGDGRIYDEWAQRIADGQGFGSDVFYQTPLYPSLLALIYRVAGHDVFLVRIVQAVWGAGSCALLALAAERLFDQRVGIVAGLLLALYGPAVFFDGLIQKSSLDVLLVAIFLYAFSRWTPSPRTAPVVLAAVAAALLSINRENARIIVPLAVAWLLLVRAPRRALIFAAAVMVVLLPVALRNYRVGGEFFVSTSQAGPNFYIGNHAGASGLYESLVPERGNARYERDDARQLAETALGHSLTAGAVSRYWVDRTLDDIRAAPGRWLALFGKKCLLAINAAEPPDAESLSAYAEQSPLLAALAWINFGMVFSLAILGVWLERTQWRSLWLLYGVAASLLLSMAAFFVFARYRLPAVPVLVMFAAVPVVRVWRARERRGLGWTLGIAAAAVAAFACRIPFDVGEDETLLNVGKQLLADERAGEALPVLRESAARHPGFAIDTYTLGVALDRTGDKNAALAQFRRAVQLAPGEARTRGALALALMQSGGAAESLPHFAESVRLSPSDASLRTNYGIALLQTGDGRDAIDQLEAAVHLDPRDVTARNALGSALGQTGDLDGALHQFQAAVGLSPAGAQAHANLGLALAGRGEIDAAVRELQQALALAKAAGHGEETRQIAAVLAQLGR